MAWRWGTVSQPCPAHRPDRAKIVDLWIPMFTPNERQHIKLLNESELRDGSITHDKVFGNQLYYRRLVVPRSVGGKKKAADTGLPIRVKLVYDAEVREATVAAAKQQHLHQVRSAGREIRCVFGR